MTELRIGILVDGTMGANGEVTPHIRHRSKVQLGHQSRGGLKIGLGIFSGDATCNHMARQRLGFHRLKVNGGVFIQRITIQFANLGHPMQINAHGELELCGGQVDTSDELGDRVFDLQAWVEFEEVVLVVGRVQVFDGAGARISYLFGEPDCGQLHLTPHLDGQPINRDTGDP